MREIFIRYLLQNYIK